MKWADFQSVIQLAVALNTIYLSLRDIRVPVIRYEEDALRQLKADASPRIYEYISTEIDRQLIELNQNIILIIADFNIKKYKFEDKDIFLGKISMFVAILFSGLLVVSAYLASHDMQKYLPLLIAAVGFLPLGLGLVLNINLVRDIKKSVRCERRKIESKLINLRLKRKD